MEIKFEIKASDGGVCGEDIDYEGNLTFIETTTIPSLRLKVCGYFLSKLKNNLNNEFAVKTYLEIIFIFLRSSTFTMQNICSKEAGFKEWYKIKQDEMKADLLLRKFIELRNAAEKKGGNLISFGPVVDIFHHKDGQITHKISSPDISFEEFYFKDVVNEIQSAISKIEEIVEEAHQLGFLDNNRNSTQFRQRNFVETETGHFSEIQKTV